MITATDNVQIYENANQERVSLNHGPDDSSTELV